VLEDLALTIAVGPIVIVEIEASKRSAIKSRVSTRTPTIGSGQLW
jgi:hypothetical protein